MRDPDRNADAANGVRTLPDDAGAPARAVRESQRAGAARRIGPTATNANGPASIFRQGAAIVPDILTEAEERRILMRIGDAFWMTDLGRRVQHYGFRYDYRNRASSRRTPAPAFPRWAQVMAARLRPLFDGASPEQCIVNEYRPGQGIGMHADHGDFGPVVVSLSLGAAWRMQFRPRRIRPYVRDAMPSDEAATLPRRSALVLRGPARQDWMHGIDRAANARQPATRVSATFRTMTA